MSNKKRKVDVPTIPCSWTGCGLQFANDWDLNGHIEAHLETLKPHSNGNYNCVWGACSFSTKCITEIQRHIYYHGYYNGLLVHGKNELETNPSIPRCNAVPRECDKIPDLHSDFRCEWVDCNRTFISIVEFQDHIVQHASFEYEIQKSPDDERPKIQCNWNYCKKQMDNKYRLIEHIRTHSNKKQVACYHCGELFRTKTTLFDHLRRQPENNTQKYQCAQCSKYFATEKLLRSHMIKHVNTYKCSMCDMTCSSASALATHIRYRHLKDKPFKCVECEYRCVRESDLNQHVQLVHSQEVHRCEESGCTYAVKTFQALRKHFLEVHRNTTFIYLCHCCEKPFKSGKSLSVHLIKKHDFQLPSGHRRFTYRIDENGFYRLETTRIESLEVTEQILTPTTFELTEVTEDSNSYEIVSLTNKQDAERVIVSNDRGEVARPAGEVIISLPNLD
ncbi:histone H4 transcription factor [Haematobia irritans]|uniref:histone H4 transcription factor n=1 Tax=Haematobia irritans TaxID=7368 RepID=UPI003F4F628C